MNRIETIATKAIKHLGWTRQDRYNLRSVAKRLDPAVLSSMLDRIESLLSTYRLTIPQTMYRLACEPRERAPSDWNAAAVAVAVLVHTALITFAFAG